MNIINLDTNVLLIDRMLTLSIDQKQLSEMTGLSIPTISRIINGKQEPHYRNKLKIAEKLKCDVFQLFPVDRSNTMAHIINRISNQQKEND